MKNKITAKNVLHWALCLNLFAVFFLSFGLAGRYPYNYLNIALWLTLGVLYFIARRRKHIKSFKFRFDIFTVAMLLYCLAIILSYILSGFLEFSKAGIVCALSGLMIYWILSDGLISKKMMLLCAGTGALALLVLFACVYHDDILHPDFSKRIGTFFNNQNEIALNLALCMILLFALGLEVKKWCLKIGGILFSLVAFYFILLTGSVSAVLTSAIAFFVSIPFYFKKNKIIAIVVEAAIVAAGMFVIFNAPAFSYFAERIKGMFSSLGLESGTGDSSFESRFSSIIVGLRIFLENPLFGAGNGAVYRNYSITSHNNFAQVLACYGIFAFLAHEALMILPLARLRKSHKSYWKLVLPMLLYIFLFQFFLFTFNSKPASILVAVCFYLMFPEGCYTKEMKRASIKTTKLNI